MGVKKRAPEPDSFFRQFWVASSSLSDGLMCDPYAPVQSKHTFRFLHFFRKKGPRRVPTGSILGSFFNPKLTFGVKQGVLNSGPKKGALSESNSLLLTDPEVPGAAASCAR